MSKEEENVYAGRCPERVHKAHEACMDEIWRSVCEIMDKRWDADSMEAQWKDGTIEVWRSEE